MSDFKECGSCAVKPGAPELCESCLHNRSMLNEQDRTIGVLQDQLAKEIARRELAEERVSRFAERLGDIAVKYDQRVDELLEARRLAKIGGFDSDEFDGLMVKAKPGAAYTFCPHCKQRWELT